MCMLHYAIVQACHNLLAVTQNGAFTCSVCDWEGRAESAKEAQRAILLSPSLLLLLIWLMLRLQQAHHRRHLLQLCFITSWWLQP